MPVSDENFENVKTLYYNKDSVNYELADSIAAGFTRQEDCKFTEYISEGYSQLIDVMVNIFSQVYSQYKNGDVKKLMTDVEFQLIDTCVTIHTEYLTEQPYYIHPEKLRFESEIGNRLTLSDLLIYYSDGIAMIFEDVPYNGSDIDYMEALLYERLACIDCHRIWEGIEDFDVEIVKKEKLKKKFI